MRRSWQERDEGPPHSPPWPPGARASAYPHYLRFRCFPRPPPVCCPPRPARGSKHPGLPTPPAPPFQGQQPHQVTRGIAPLPRGVHPLATGSTPTEGPGGSTPAAGRAPPPTAPWGAPLPGDPQGAPSPWGGGGKNPCPTGSTPTKGPGGAPSPQEEHPCPGGSTPKGPTGNTPRPGVGGGLSLSPTVPPHGWSHGGPPESQGVPRAPPRDAVAPPPRPCPWC